MTDTREQFEKWFLKLSSLPDSSFEKTWVAWQASAQVAQGRIDELQIKIDALSTTTD